jgi:hypothetical protein
MIEAIAAALLLGGINTLADFAAVELRLTTKPIYAFARIALICYVVGAVVGARARQLMIGTIGGVMIGALAGGVYYFLAPHLGFEPSMAIVWVIFWVSFSLLDALLEGGSGIGTAVLQGLLAALASGGFYYAASGILATSLPKDVPLLVRSALTWSAAFLPGFVVLFWRRM